MSTGNQKNQRVRERQDTGMSLRRGLLLGAISGGLLYLSFPPANFWPLAFIALLPLIMAVLSVRRWTKALGVSGVCALTAYVPLLAWLSPVTVGGWLVLGGYVGAYLIVCCLVGRYLYRRFPRIWPLLFACVWVGMELVRARFATGFPWLLIGYSQYSFTSLLQLAAVTGVFGVSWVVVLCNASFAFLGLKFLKDKNRDSRTSVLTWPAIATAVLVACAGWGVFTMQGLDMRENTVVGVIQPNVCRRVSELIMPPEVQRAKERLENRGDQMEPDTREELEGKVREYWNERDRMIKNDITGAAALSRSLEGRDLDLLVWPETTVQVPLNVAPPMYREGSSTRGLRRYAGETLKKLARDLDCYLLVGAPATFSRTAGYVQEPRYSLDAQHSANSVVLINPAGEYVDRYDKMHLVPFGEYVPLTDVFPFLGVFTPMTRNLTPGSTPVIFEITTDRGNETQFAAPICYEDVVSPLMRRFKRRGANFFVVATDEGWYTWPGELRQHVAMAAFRAVETRSTVVRAANTGISCFIDPIGRVYASVSRRGKGKRVDRWVRGAQAAPVRRTDATTPYMMVGDLFSWGCLLIGLLAALSKHLLVVLHHLPGLHFGESRTSED